MAETMNFTKAALDGLALPKAGKRAEWVDARVGALRLRVTSTGVKTFCVLKRVRGAGMERITIGRYPEVSIEAARRKAADLLGRIATGDNPAEVKRALRRDMTLDEFFEQEYAPRHGRSLRSWRDSEQRYRDHLKPVLGKRKLTAITGDMVSRILSSLEASGRANATVNNVRALASGVLGKAVEWEFLDSNPVRRTKTRKAISRDRFLVEAELPRFFEALDAEPDDVVRDFFYIALLTGARRSNVQAMRWQEVDLRRGVWRIPVTKNGEPQNVTLCEHAMLILGERRERTKGEFVFPGCGRTGHLVEPKKAWARVLRRAQITDLRIHDLRRTLGSWQAMNGSSLLIIGKSLNHKTPQATKVYARLELDPVRESVNRATDAILQAGRIRAVSPACSDIEA